MAIGSSPEIGATVYHFPSDPEGQQRWYNHIRDNFGPDGLRGYATVGFIQRYVGKVPAVAIGSGRRNISQNVDAGASNQQNDSSGNQPSNRHVNFDT